MSLATQRAIAATSRKVEDIMTIAEALAVVSYYGNFDALDTPEQVALLKAAKEIVRENAQQALVKHRKAP